MTITELITSGKTRAEVRAILIEFGKPAELAEFEIALALGEIDGDYVDLSGSAEPSDDVRSAGPWDEIGQQYTESLKAHLKHVYDSAELLGVPENQIRQHDASKWSEAEFWPYAINFYGSDEQKDANKEAFDRAWLHHLHHNPHHWQHWLLNLDDGRSRPLRMPDNYALEMVADWRGASLAYTGSADMTDWLNDRFSWLNLHDETRAYVLTVLTEKLGYRYTVSYRHADTIYKFGRTAADS